VLLLLLRLVAVDVVVVEASCSRLFFRRLTSTRPRRCAWSWRRQSQSAHCHADEVNPINRNVVVQRQIADHRLGHLLRAGDCHLPWPAEKPALRRRSHAGFSAAWPSHRARLRVLAQYGLSRLENDFRLRRGLVLIDVGDHLLHCIQACVRLLRGLLRAWALLPASMAC